MSDPASVSGESAAARQSPAQPGTGTSQNAPPALPIDYDLPCIGCRYNLRTKTVAERCPECGLEVARTLAHLREHAGAIADFRAFRAAAGIFAGISIAAVPLRALQAFAESPWASRMAGPEFLWADALATDVFHIGFLVLLVAGVWLLSTGISQRILGGARTFPLVITAVYALLGATTTLGEIGLLVRWHARIARMGRLLAMQAQPRIGTALVGALLLWYGYAAFGGLARAVASERLGRMARWVFLLQMVQCLLPVGILVVVRSLGPGGRFFYVEPKYFFAADVLAAASFGIFAWFWLALPGMVRGAAGAEAAGPSQSADGGAVRTEDMPGAEEPGKKVAEFIAGRRTAEKHGG